MSSHFDEYFALTRAVPTWIIVLHKKVGGQTLTEWLGQSQYRVLKENIIRANSGTGNRSNVCSRIRGHLASVVIQPGTWYSAHNRRLTLRMTKDPEN
jgi:hypothetical protein